MMIKQSLKHILFGLALPVVLLAAAFVIPEPYSHAFISVGIAPAKLMPFLEDKKLMHQLTLLIFQRQTPNHAPLSLIFLVVFWFAFGTLASIAIYHFQGIRKDA